MAPQHIPSIITSIVFVEQQYWSDAEACRSCADAVHDAVASAFKTTNASILRLTVEFEAELDGMAGGEKRGLGVFTALNGSVQQWMLNAAPNFSVIALCAGFVGGFITMPKGRMLLERNAAPATMDVFSELQRGAVPVWFIRNAREIVPLWEALEETDRRKAATEAV